MRDIPTEITALRRLTTVIRTLVACEVASREQRHRPIEGVPRDVVPKLGQLGRVERAKIACWIPLAQETFHRPAVWWGKLLCQIKKTTRSDSEPPQDRDELHTLTQVSILIELATHRLESRDHSSGAPSADLAGDVREFLSNLTDIELLALSDFLAFRYAALPRGKNLGWWEQTVAHSNHAFCLDGIGPVEKSEIFRIIAMSHKGGDR